MISEDRPRYVVPHSKETNCICVCSAVCKYSVPLCVCLYVSDALFSRLAGDRRRNQYHTSRPGG